jgi:hypothetical protein
MARGSLRRILPAMVFAAHSPCPGRQSRICAVMVKALEI